MAERIITVAERNLWVYVLPLPKDEAFAAIAEPQDKWDEGGNMVLWPLGVAVGLPYLDHDFVEPAWIEDLNESLFDHVVGQTGSDPTVIEPSRQALNVSNGLVIFISRDLDADEPSRTPDAPYQFLGVFLQESYSFSLGVGPATVNPAPKPTPKSVLPKPSDVQTSASPMDPNGAQGRPHSRKFVTALVVGAMCLIPLIYWALQ